MPLPGLRRQWRAIECLDSKAKVFEVPPPLQSVLWVWGLPVALWEGTEERASERTRGAGVESPQVLPPSAGSSLGTSWRCSFPVS